jgi:hypothetical protein
MAFYIEEFDEHQIKKHSVSKNCRYDTNGCATDNWKNTLHQIYKNGTKILLERVDLSEKKGNQFDLQTFINLTNYLDDNVKQFDVCSYIIIEQQLKKNPMAQRLEQHCVSWFTFTYLDTKQIIIYPASNKTRVLGAPKKVIDKNGILKKMTKIQRKNWACDEASKILNLRDDIHTIHHIFSENKSKKDDLSDVIVQLNSWKIKYFMDGQLK